MQAEYKNKGIAIPTTKLCAWLGIPRRTFYYHPTIAPKKLDLELVDRIRLTIQEFPTYGYRRLAFLLKRNRKAVQRILQMKGWQVRKRPQGKRPRVRAKRSRSEIRNTRWATDMAMIWCGKDRWCHLAAVIDCASREILGWRLSARGNAKTAHAALEEALIQRFGHVGRVSEPLVLRSDNGLVFTSNHFTTCVKSYGISQEFIEPQRPDQNGIVERFFRSLKEECVWLHRFKSFQHAHATIDRYIRYYNTARPHQALGYQSPASAVLKQPAA